MPAKRRHATAGDHREDVQGQRRLDAGKSGRLARQSRCPSRTCPKRSPNSTSRSVRTSSFRIREPGSLFPVLTAKSQSQVNRKQGESAATREAYGDALVKVADQDPRIVALDGDTKNSTFSEKLLKAHPKRFFEMFIAEQNMVGAATGLAARGKIPFVSTFAAFLTRAFDQIRMAGVSQSNVKFCGSHAGVSIGEDGPSQMALEDLAMFRTIPGSVVLYPCDAVSAERAVEQAAHPSRHLFISGRAGRRHRCFIQTMKRFRLADRKSCGRARRIMPPLSQPGLRFTRRSKRRRNWRRRAWRFGSSMRIR